MNKLSNEALLSAYYAAKKQNLDPEFISIIEEEIKVRKLHVIYGDGEKSQIE
ncbi:sporulation histidine kinase inhibitor Sda [Halobacillus litoralis]|uniref:Sporulation histidine kinase inhibitor Sda n=1 Tax=Halobacillus litoralis TaxID=45668 RepID=A0A410MFP8_9BACI|nr:sporulation histidine kinase inhibitor Sda [Halobacillus litoralis]QAS53551.1 sporulation histidine kinase inhibitor Sda [Halobacillus litoralis]